MSEYAIETHWCDCAALEWSVRQPPKCWLYATNPDRADGSAVSCFDSGIVATFLWEQWPDAHLSHNTNVAIDDTVLSSTMTTMFSASITLSPSASIPLGHFSEIK